MKLALVQTLLITGAAAAAAVSSTASCGSLHTTSGTCCSSSGKLGASFECNTIAACCAACFNSVKCTSWTHESQSGTAGASSLCTLQSSCTAKRGNCTRGELRPPAPASSPKSVGAIARRGLSPTEGYPELESEFRETTAEEFLVAWRELHRKQKLRWAAGWATRSKKSGALASRLRGGRGHAHDLRIVDKVAREVAAALATEVAAAQATELVISS